MALILFVAGDWIVSRGVEQLGGMWRSLRGLASDPIGLAIGSPAVYTRERLLNDRFEQVAWLDALIQQSAQDARIIRPPPDAKTPDNASTPDGKRVATASPAPETSASLSSTRDREVQRPRNGRDDFGTINGYRDVLRAERAREMLDDSHDMDGNTLHLLSFDATILPGPAAQGYAAIEAVLTRDPKDLVIWNGEPAVREAATSRMRDFELQDMFDIYTQWLTRTRRSHQAQMRNVTLILDKERRSNSSRADEHVIPDLMRILKSGACAEVMRLQSKGRPALLDERLVACRQALDAGVTPTDRMDAFHRPATLTAEARQALQIVDDVQMKYSWYLSQLQMQSNLQAEAPRLLQLLHSTILNERQKGPLRAEREKLERVTAWGIAPAPSDCAIGKASTPVADGWLVRLSQQYLVTQDSDESPGGVSRRPLIGFISLEPDKLTMPCPAIQLQLGQKAALLYSIIHNGDDTTPSDSADPGVSSVGLLLPGGQSVTQGSIDRATSTCIAAEYLQTIARRPTLGMQSSYGGSLDHFFDLRLRRHDDICELNVEPRIESLARLNADASQDVSGRRPRRTFDVATSTGNQPPELNTLRVTDSGTLARFWKHGAWRHVWDEASLTVSIGPFDRSFSLVEVIPVDGTGQDREAILRFKEDLPFYARWSGLQVVASDLGDGSKVTALTAAGETTLLSLDVASLSPFQIRGPNGVGQEPSPEQPLAVVLQGCGAWDGVKIVEKTKSRHAGSGRLSLRHPFPQAAATAPIPTLKPLEHQVDELCRANLEHGRNLLFMLRTMLEVAGYSERSGTSVTRAVSYGLTPRLRQDIARSERRSDGLQAMLGSLGVQANDTRVASRASSEPEIVGFNRPDAALGLAGARFGWIVTPRLDSAGVSEWSMPVEQLQLGAVVAVPSWWRSALLQVCRRFAGRLSPGTLMSESFWSKTDGCHVETIRLPGTANDVSRRLGVEVITTPFVDPIIEDSSVESNMGGNLIATLESGDDKGISRVVITGERLWRSTVVTLGAQQANRIEVLPDMSGIIAHFDCVAAPTTFLKSQPDAPESGLPTVTDSTAIGVAGNTSVTSSKPDSKPTILFTVPLVVWTSEGHTELRASIRHQRGATCPPPGTPPRNSSPTQAPLALKG